MIPKNIITSNDLQTKQQAICDGFLFQSLQKAEKAVPIIKRAFEFKAALAAISSIDEILTLTEFKDEIATSCGFSEKSKSHLTKDELDHAIKAVFDCMLELSINNIKDEVLFRYILTKGDALGGSIRNLTGASASFKVVNMIDRMLRTRNTNIQVLKNKKGKVQKISWGNRTLLFDASIKIINKNIDIVLLNGNLQDDINNLLTNSNNFMACGELKGGIDPAGADEHWKTANSALSRIRDALKPNVPCLFFIGAAIEASMANEIFLQLNDGRLSHAANLNDEAQMYDLIDWLLSL